MRSLSHFALAGKVIAAALAFSALAFQAQTVQAQATDPVVLTFSTVGDSRQDPVAPDASQLPVSAQDQNWLQNTKAISRIVRTIQSQKSSLLFFNGDMIMGYGNTIAPAAADINTVLSSDLVQTYKQYAYWRGMMAPVMENGTYIVPVPGNHEVQCKACGKIALQANENAWAANMGDLILDTTRFQNMFGATPSNINYGPAAGTSPDGLTTDQSKLSYSFDFQGSHFVVINTDPVGNDGHAPTAWLAADLASAQARGNSHFFVFGHKPAYTYKYNDATLVNGVPKDTPITKLSGFDLFPSNLTAFWALMEQYGATYFCGHEHIFDMRQPTAATGGTAYQVLVGSGGSPFDAAVVDSHNAPTDRTYAWATVSVHQSGKVDIKAYGFNDAYGPTQLLKSVTLPH